MNIFKGKKVKIVSNYIHKDRVDLKEIQNKLHPLNLNGTSPDKSKIDSLNKNRMNVLKNNLKKWK